MAGRKSVSAMFSKRPSAKGALARIKGVASRGSKCSGSGASSAPRWMLIAAFAILALLAATLVYQYMVASALSRSSERFADASGAPYTLVYLYMDGCGWCERFKDQWTEIETNRSAELAKMGVATAKFERAQSGAKAYASAVQGYPTILLAKPDGTTVKFQGERTADEVVAFVRSNVGPREGFFDGEQSFSSMGSAIKNANDRGSQETKNVDDRKKGAGAKV